MKILHLAERYPPFIGGMELAVQRLATEQADGGHEVHVATLLPSSVEAARRERSEAGVEVHRLGHLPLGDYHPPSPEPVVAAQLLSILRGGGAFDVVHAHGLMGFSYAALKRARLARTPLVWNVHDYGLICPTRTRLFVDKTICEEASWQRCRQCTKGAYGEVRGLPVILGLRASQGLRSEVNAWIAPTRAVAAPHHFPRVAIVKPGVVPAEAYASEPLPGFVPPEPYIMYAGRLGEAKGTDVLLEAYRQLEEPRPPLLMLAANAGDHEEINLPGVRLVRNAPYAQTRAAWGGALVAVVPSVWGDPAPTVAAEALSAGTPVIASEIGGLAEMVGDGGILVPPGDPAALAAALRKVIDDPGLRRQLGDAGREVARHYSISAVAGQFMGVYEEAIEDARG